MTGKLKRQFKRLGAIIVFLIEHPKFTYKAFLATEITLNVCKVYLFNITTNILNTPIKDVNLLYILGIVTVILFAYEFIKYVLLVVLSE